MDAYKLPGPSGRVLTVPAGLERTQADLTDEELDYLLNYCVLYDVNDVLQHGSGRSSSVISQVAGLAVVENDEKMAKSLLAAAPPARETYNYAVLKTPPGFTGSGTTQKFKLFVINGMREQSVAAFEELQRSMNDAYEMADVVFVVDGMNLNALRLQAKYLAPYYNVVTILYSDKTPVKDRYLIHWERNLLTNRKSVV